MTALDTAYDSHNSSVPSAWQTEALRTSGLDRPYAGEIDPLQGTSHYSVLVGATLYLTRDYNRRRTSILHTLRNQTVTAAFGPVKFAKAYQTIADLEELPEGWDGYTGRPVQHGVAVRARDFLAAVDRIMSMAAVTEPAAVPLSNGGLQLEWHENECDLEVAFYPSGEDLVSFECAGPSWDDVPLNELFGVEIATRAIFRKMWW